MPSIIVNSLYFTCMVYRYMLLLGVSRQRDQELDSFMVLNYWNSYNVNFSLF